MKVFAFCHSNVVDCYLNVYLWLQDCYKMDLQSSRNIWSLVREEEVVRLEKSSEMENNDMKAERCSESSLAASLMNLKMYFAEEGLINDCVHEGPSLPLLTSGSPNTFSHISSFIKMHIESCCLFHTVPQHPRILKNDKTRLNSYLLTCCL